MAEGLTPCEALRHSHASPFLYKTLFARMTAFTPSELLLVSEQLSVMKSEVGSSAVAIFCPTPKFESHSRRG